MTMVKMTRKIYNPDYKEFFVKPTTALEKKLQKALRKSIDEFIHSYNTCSELQMEYYDLSDELDTAHSFSRSSVYFLNNRTEALKKIKLLLTADTIDTKLIGKVIKDLESDPYEDFEW